MEITINEQILKKYPKMEIGYLVANVVVRKQDPHINTLKQSFIGHLQKLGLNATNFVTHPNLAIWRKIYKEDFQETAYRSSIESLVRRIATGKELWNISNVVDLYNCCSILSLLPMGGYDVSKISGNIEIRYAKEREAFQGIGERLKIEAKSHHIVYADEERVMCWLWNHKDSCETCIDEQTNQVIFFIDSVQPRESDELISALELLRLNLEAIKCEPLTSGILNSQVPRRII